MRDAGVADETILEDTGWFVGADGKWRWEIDDSGMEFNRRGDNHVIGRYPGYTRYRELLDKAESYMLGISEEALTEEEQGRLLHLDKKRSQTILAGMSGVLYPQRAIQEVDFKKNIQDFWADVKWENAKNNNFLVGNKRGKTAFARAYEEAQRRQSLNEVKQKYGCCRKQKRKPILRA